MEEARQNGHAAFPDVRVSVNTSTSKSGANSSSCRRAAVVAATTAALLVPGVAVAGSAVAGPPAFGSSADAPPANENAVLHSPQHTEPHGRKLG